MRYFVLISIGWVSFLSCKESPLAKAAWEWRDARWVQGDIKSMTISVSDTTQRYQMELELEHDKTYSYQNLYVRATTTFPSGKEVKSVFSMELLDAQGQWAGQYTGGCCEINFPLQEKFTFPEIGTYTWTIEPWMRIDTIKGIEGIEVVCRKMPS